MFRLLTRIRFPAISSRSSIKDRLCRLALLTSQPSISTGVNTATGAISPVLPGVHSMYCSRLSCRSSSNLYGTIKALRVYQRNVPYLPNTFRPAVIQYLQLCPFPKCPAQLIQVFDHAIFSFPRPTGQFCCAVCSPFLPAAYLPKFNSWTIR